MISKITQTVTGWYAKFLQIKNMYSKGSINPFNIIMSMMKANEPMFANLKQVFISFSDRNSKFIHDKIIRQLTVRDIMSADYLLKISRMNHFINKNNMLAFFLYMNYYDQEVFESLNEVTSLLCYRMKTDHQITLNRIILDDAVPASIASKIDASNMIIKHLMNLSINLNERQMDDFRKDKVDGGRQLLAVTLESICKTLLPHEMYTTINVIAEDFFKNNSQSFNEFMSDKSN